MPIVDHPYHIKVAANTQIWRYMDLKKYESLLIEKALFLCRADIFPDPFEGSLPKREADFRITYDEQHAVFHGRTFDKEEALKKIEAMKYTHKMVKRATTVNCWQINDNESTAMWANYLKDNIGVAIQSTYQKLIDSLQESKQELGLSKVRYLNYDKDIWFDKKEFPHMGYNVLTPLFHKRKEFDNEKELRVYHHNNEAEKDGYWEIQSNFKGEFANVNVEILVEKVILPPTIDKFFENKILELTAKLNYKFPIEKSKLSSDPIY